MVAKRRTCVADRFFSHGKTGMDMAECDVLKRVEDITFHRADAADHGLRSTGLRAFSVGNDVLVAKKDVPSCGIDLLSKEELPDRFRIGVDAVVRKKMRDELGENIRQEPEGLGRGVPEKVR